MQFYSDFFLNCKKVFETRQHAFYFTLLFCCTTVLQEVNEILVSKLFLTHTSWCTLVSLVRNDLVCWCLSDDKTASTAISASVVAECVILLYSLNLLL